MDDENDEERGEVVEFGERNSTEDTKPETDITCHKFRNVHH